MSPWRQAVLAGAALVALAAACSATSVSKILDATATGQQIGTDLATKYGAAPVVTCPAGVKVQAGKTFDCRTAIEGQPLVLHVTLTDSRGRLTYRPDAAVVVVAKIAGAIQTSEATATVKCGPHAVRVEQPKATFVCSAGTASGPVTYRVTVEDLAGNVRYEPVTAPAAG